MPCSQTHNLDPVLVRIFAHRMRRWPGIQPTLAQLLLFARMHIIPIHSSNSDAQHVTLCGWCYVPSKTQYHCSNLNLMPGNV